MLNAYFVYPMFYRNSVYQYQGTDILKNFAYYVTRLSNNWGGFMLIKNEDLDPIDVPNIGRVTSKVCVYFTDLVHPGCLSHHLCETIHVSFVWLLCLTLFNNINWFDLN